MFLVPCALYLVSCTTIDLYEKSVAIPGHSWKNDFKPSFTFTIKDTVPAYQLYLVLRHNDKYNYNNIYIRLHSQLPNQDTTQLAIYDYDLLLATDEKGWLTNGMDDIYEHRLLLTPAGENFYFRKKGDYTYTIEQFMREDPLKNILDVGLRIEKKQ